MDQLRIEERDGAVFLSFLGEITLDITSDLKEKIEGVLADSDVSNIVVDLSRISFLDSSGIGFLVALNTKLKGLGKKMFLFKPSTQVKKTLELVQLASFFQMLDDDDDLLTLLP